MGGKTFYRSRDCQTKHRLSRWHDFTAANRFSIDLHGHGTLKHSYGNDDEGLPFFLQQNSYYAFKRAARNLDILPQAGKWMGLRWKSGTKNRSDTLDFAVGYWRRPVTKAHDRNNARGSYNRQPSFWVKPTEQIASEKRLVSFDNAIRPPPKAAVNRKVRFVAFVLQRDRSDLFLICFGLKRIPREPGETRNISLDYW
jgi:hypothetical protein